MMSMHPFRRLITVMMGLGVLFFLALSCNNNANEAAATETEAVAESTAKTPVQEGYEFYMSYCTMCHGEDGKGGGVLADSLKMPPLDLTTITLRRAEFPKDILAKIIAGVEDVPGHGTGDMPAWQETFKEAERITDDAVITEKINNIVAYLETIQLDEWPGE